MRFQLPPDEILCWNCAYAVVPPVGDSEASCKSCQVRPWVIVDVLRNDYVAAAQADCRQSVFCGAPDAAFNIILYRHYFRLHNIDFPLDSLPLIKEIEHS